MCLRDWLLQYLSFIMCKTIAFLMFMLFVLLCNLAFVLFLFFFFQAEDGIRDLTVTGVQTCALPISVVRLVESLALEVVEHGIRVNCVAPGFVATRMHEQTLAAGEAAGLDYLARTKTELAKGGVPPSVAARTIAFLLSPAAEAITGRFVAATHDHWEQWPEHLAEIRGSDLFTLRRIVPRDRGMDWQ